MKVFLQTLGCEKNRVDSEMILGVCKNLGINPTDNPQDADLLIVNTCAFIESARVEAINTILDIIDYKTGNKKLIVVGCLAQRYKEELIKELPEVDRFITIKDYINLSNVICEVLDINSNTNVCMNFLDRVYDDNTPYQRYVRISDGCLNRCAFCAIPLIRGRLKSRPMDDIIEEVKMHVSAGVKELCIVSQDTTNYGFDLEHRLMLTDLLKKICAVEGNFKVRLFYLYPEIVTDELIDFIKNEPKMMPYFDIPIQHSEDKILKLMYRRSNKQMIIDLLHKIRKEIPNAILRTTIMVGFPYETEEDIHNLCEFIKDVKFDRLGCFTFSPEEGTAAYKMPQEISEEEKMRRYNFVMDTQYDISLSQNKSHIGEIQDVIIEGYDEENLMYFGRSYAFAPDDIDGRVYVACHDEKNIGDIVRAKVLDCDAYSLTCEEYEEN